MSQASEELARYRSGAMSLDDLGRLWAARRWGAPGLHETPSTPAEVWERAEDRERAITGTWQEIRNMVLDGRLSQEEYTRISATADGAPIEAAAP